MRAAGKHLVLVEAYDGFVELLSDEPGERRAARGLGLPLEEIAARLGCRITVLAWDEWCRYEATGRSFFSWMPAPATRPLSPLAFDERPARLGDGVRTVAIAARDPGHRLPFATGGLSPLTHGLLANSDVLFLAAYCLNIELQALYREDPFDAVVIPMWGGSGYVAQMTRATGAPGAVDVPFAVVVTDVSANRQRANQEGLWTRPGMIRRQMEDVSLAIADLVLTFGPRGDGIAAAGRLPEAQAAVRAPRFVEDTLLDCIAEASERSGNVGKGLEMFLHEPQEAASGVLVTLDAVALLRDRGTRLERGIVSAGPDMTFAPMKPCTFAAYWSSRGFVRELVGDGQWEWANDYTRRDEAYAVRLYPSAFEHLPDVWSELARGTFVVLSPAAAEGLAPGEALPGGAVIEGEPGAENVAACLRRIAATDCARLDAVRRELCAKVVAAHRGARRHRLLEETADALGRLLHRAPEPQNLARAALLLLDRRLPLKAIVEVRPPSERSVPQAGSKDPTLSVVVTCYEMGVFLRETVESVWASTRQPDEVLLIDDGSHGAETLAIIGSLERSATERGLPLRVMRQGNRGLAGARNAGLAAASGEFVSFLDGDDIIESRFYEVALALLERHPDLGGVAAWALCFGDGVPDGFWNAPQPELPLLLVENTVIVPCMVRTETLRQIGGYDTRQRYNYEDWELSIRMLASGRPIVTIPMYLQRYRMRRDSLFRTMSDVQNQGMRELLLSSHRETVEKFAMETAMQLEHQLAKFVHAPERAGGGGTNAAGIKWLRARARTALAAAAEVLNRRRGVP